ncbi:glycosyltransferase [Novosphingobium sp. SG707]|uniref:glycosyltransferase n=1 Tax=Novosphingobium sp. SG707 TaxID=2586996 RepID=UPI001447FB8E|nr:glycosyltransferase [Novosphingobium sp. SG707]NKJ02918.1 glycosyltransferase involved in cell wall biosynthesis [Novosphingobium sp. SG707]
MPKLLNMNAYHYRRGGSDVVYLEHGALFEQRGWDCGYMAMQHPKNDPTPWSRYFVPEIEMGHDYSLLRKVAIAKEVIYSTDHVRSVNRLLDDFPADIAHIHILRHHVAANIFPAMQKRGVRIVLTAHELKLLCPAYRMHDGQAICEDCKPNAVWHCTIKRCMHGSLALSGLISVESAVHRMMGYYRKYLDRIICPSRFYLEKHVEWGWPREKLIYIPNDFDVPPLQQVPAPGDYLCYFGRLSFEKGLVTVIKAAAAAGMPLQLVGEGPEEPKLRELAAETGAQVVFHGRQTGEALFSVVSNARACVLAAEWYENAPKSVLEAFGLGKVVIGADIGGITEMIRPGETGFLFPSKDALALAQVLRELRDVSDERLIEMGAKAARFASTEFSTDLYFRRMEALYAELGVERKIMTEV